MKTALDTNILSAVWSNEPSAQRIAVAMGDVRQTGLIVISPPAYAECLAHPFHTEHYIESFLKKTAIVVDLPLHQDIWRTAGQRYRQYAMRRRQSRLEPPRRLLADFLIGAHALLQADQLLTLDLRFYRTYYPEVRLYPIDGLTGESL